MATLQEAIDSLGPNVEKSLELTERAIAMSRKTGFQYGLATGLNIKGNTLRLVGNTSEAVPVLKEALHVSEVNNFRNNAANVLNNLANVYDDVGDYQSAFKTYEQAVQMYGAMKDSLNMAHTYGNMGIVMHHLRNYEKANVYYFKSIDLLKALHEPVGALFAEVAGNYIEQKNYPGAFDILFRNLKIADSNDREDALPVTYMNLGLCYDQVGNNDSALYYYLKAEELYKIKEDAANESALLNDIGSVYIEQNKLGAAEKYSMEALALAKSTHNNGTLYGAYDNLAVIYAKRGDYPKAYTYMKWRAEIRDTLLNEEKMHALTELATRYETKEIEEKNTLLQKENDLQQLRLKQKDILLFGALTGLALLTGMAVLLLRQNRLLRDQQRIELAHKQLYAQMNPHFIFNCLSSIQHFILQNDTKSANRYLTNFANLMRQTLENSKTATITLREEIKYLNSYLAMEHLRFGNKFNYEIKCEESVDADTIEIPPMMIQPFAENAIRHGLSHYKNNEGRLNISFYVKDGSLYCEVDDNGIGREQSQLLKEQTSAAYRSHGMEVTKERLDLVSKIKKADYSVMITDKMESGTPTGTLVTIKFPIQV
jgi:tetratricopeptide (TPR) repeat protein